MQGHSQINCIFFLADVQIDWRDVPFLLSFGAHSFQKAKHYDTV